MNLIKEERETFNHHILQGRASARLILQDAIYDLRTDQFRIGRDEESSFPEFVDSSLLLGPGFSCRTEVTGAYWK
jgi:hypothetical protein